MRDSHDEVTPDLPGLPEAPLTLRNMPASQQQYRLEPALISTLDDVTEILRALDIRLWLTEPELQSSRYRGIKHLLVVMK